MENLTDEQVLQWQEDITTQLDALQECIGTIINIISEGGVDGHTVVQETSSNDMQLANTWQSFSSCMDISNQKLNSQSEIFKSSIQTFVDMVRQANEEHSEDVGSANTSFESYSDDINNL